MESRRQDDFGVNSSTPARLKNQRIERVFDPYSVSRLHLIGKSPPRRKLSHPRRMMDGGLSERRDYDWEVDTRTGRSIEKSPRVRRSLSPPRRMMFSGPSERRDYGNEMNAGTERRERMRFRSPSPTFDERLPNYGKRYLNRDKLRERSDFGGFMERRYELDDGLKYRGVKGNAEGGKVLATGGDQFLSDKRGVREDGWIAQETYRSMAGVEPALRNADGAVNEQVAIKDGWTAQETYRSMAGSAPALRRADGAVNLPSSSRDQDIRFKDEKVLYPDPYRLVKLPSMERYREVENCIQSKDLAYSGSAPLTREFSNTAELAGFAHTSLQSSREKVMISYQDGVPLASDAYTQKSIQGVEEFPSFELHQRRHSETGGHPESSRKDLLGYRRGTFGPPNADDWQYRYPRPQFEDTDYIYPLKTWGSKFPTVEPEDYSARDFRPSDLMEFTKEHMSKAEYSQRLHGSTVSGDHQSLPDLSSVEYFPASRGRILLDQDGALRERLRKSPRNPYDMGAHRHLLENKQMRSCQDHIYNSPEGSIKRKYGIDEELNRCSARGTTSCKPNGAHIVMAKKEKFEKWKDEEDIDLFSSKSSEYYHDKNRTTRAFDVVQHDGLSTSDDWLYCDPEDYVEQHSNKLIKSGKRNLKRRPGPGLSSGYDSYSFRKHNSTKKVWLRGKDDKELDECAVDAQELDNLPSSFKPEPTEDSEEFRRMVNTFFLAFSKKLNASSATRKRYKEQGRAGPLFCIVCGQSVSKEFKDTKGLVIHCYMSQKTGLRARHLGLHKAICVLLGWESEVAPDVTTPVPRAISVSEALSQKEDLILWPPIVVVHYISVLTSCPAARTVFTKEAVEEFLRGNGFSVGKIKVSLGVSENDNVMLVKFLGTFFALEEAEKLHQFFRQNKHGRMDLDQISLGKGKVSNGKEQETQGEKLEESLLYGYMGIAEDLDKVDYETKRRCLIRSKKEIEDFANAPVRS